MLAALLSSLYPWIKALHVIAMIAWMAALFYLPRLYVYHAERGRPGSELSETLKVMELKLLRVIMNPAMVVTWVCGLLLMVTPGVISWPADVWFHVKLALVLAMTVFHMALARWRRDFAADANRRAGRFYRIMNELPTLLMIGIVVMVIVRPF
jgi:putative membrane protein